MIKIGVNMCGRFALSATTKDIEKLRPKLNINTDITTSLNIAPTQNILSILSREPESLVYVKWGLIPSWSKDASIGNKMFNARGETLHEKPSFKNLIKKRRCLILADSFYEWKKLDGKSKKQPYRISMEDDSIFCFGGLWDIWRDINDGRLVVTATIITTEPNEIMNEIHDRMPLIIENKFYDEWLDINTEDNWIRSIIKPYTDKNMKIEEYNFKQ